LAELRLTRRASRNLAALPRPVQEAVVETLSAIQADPEGAGKELVGRLRGLWSARVGNYRVLFTIGGGARTLVIVRAIRHRAVAYRGREARKLVLHPDPAPASRLISPSVGAPRETFPRERR